MKSKAEHELMTDLFREERVQMINRKYLKILTDAIDTN